MIAIGSQLIFFKERRERIAHSHSCLKKDESERAKIKILKERIPNPVFVVPDLTFPTFWFGKFRFQLFVLMVSDPTVRFESLVSNFLFWWFNPRSDFLFWWFHFQLFSDEGFVSNFSFWWFWIRLFVLMVPFQNFRFDCSESDLIIFFSDKIFCFD